MKAFLLSASFLLFGTTLAAQQVFYFPQIGDGTAGALQFVTEIILVSTGENTQITLEFFDRQGDPLTLTLGNEQDSSFTFDLLQGQAYSRKTPGTGALKVGYARITSSETGVGGTAVFTGIDAPSGTVLFEAGVPASQPQENFTVVVDSLGRRDTGLALTRPEGTTSTQAGDLILTLYDSNFAQIATTDVPLQQGGGIAKFINEFFAGNSSVREQASEMHGILTVQGPQTAAVTLRQNVPAQGFPNGVPTLTAFPVNPGVPGQAVASSQVESLSDGRLQVALVLGNLGRQADRVHYRLWEGSRVVAETERELSGYLVTVHRLQAVEGSSISRIEAAIRDSSGGLLERFELIP